MEHQYQIKGMSCEGCLSKVEKALNSIEGVKASVTLNPPVATLHMEKHISTEKLQEVLSLAGNYQIAMKTAHDLILPQQAYTNHAQVSLPPKATSNSKNAKAIYYCPMHCEGDQTYPEQGSCPVCGMDLVAQPVQQQLAQFTCPMHPEILSNHSGSCPICGMDLVPINITATAEDQTYINLLRKFKIATFFTAPIFLIAMSEMIPNNPLFNLMQLKYWNWLAFLLSIPVVFYATWMFFERAWISIITRKLNMFTLIGIGAGVAWIFSVVALVFPNIFPAEFKTHHGTVYVYFEAATVILTLVLFGQLLEAKAHGKTNSAIRELLKLAPNTATKIIDSTEKTVAIDDIQKGDLLRVKPGERIPVDGSIQTGQVSIDESMISGEPMPVTKKPGDKVSSGTINGNNTFVMIAEKVGAETLLSQIIEMVNTASRSKAPIQKLADRISGYFVPAVILIAAITFAAWAIFGPEPAYVYALVNAIAVLIIACPCALGLATPMSVMVGVGKGAQSGILVKNAAALEKMNEIDILVIDKTGTITEGKPSVEKIISAQAALTEMDLLTKIIALNSSSEHPLAQATLLYGQQHHLSIQPITDFEAVTGKGVTGKLGEEPLALGNKKLMEQVGATISAELEQQVNLEQKLGKTVSYIAAAKQVIGFVVIYDKIKETSATAIKKLQQQGVEVMMFTGDNEDTARAVSETLHLDGFKAQLLPQDKLNEIKKLQAAGKKVAMAGDGINDAPALSQADIGIAMGTGTDVAIESASITLVKGDLTGIGKAKTLSHQVISNIKGNLLFALGYNILGIPLAAGALYPSFGLLLSPMVAALAMSLSSVSVILNSLRLRAAKID